MRQARTQRQTGRPGLAHSSLGSPGAWAHSPHAGRQTWRISIPQLQQFFNEAHAPDGLAPIPIGREGSPGHGACPCLPRIDTRRRICGTLTGTPLFSPRPPLSSCFASISVLPKRAAPAPRSVLRASLCASCPVPPLSRMFCADPFCRGVLSDRRPERGRLSLLVRAPPLHLGPK